MGVNKFGIGSREMLVEFIGSSKHEADSRDEVLLERQLDEASQSQLYVKGSE